MSHQKILATKRIASSLSFTLYSHLGLCSSQGQLTSQNRQTAPIKLALIKGKYTFNYLS